MTVMKIIWRSSLVKPFCSAIASYVHYTTKQNPIPRPRPSEENVALSVKRIYSQFALGTDKQPNPRNFRSSIIYPLSHSFSIAASTAERKLSHSLESNVRFMKRCFCSRSGPLIRKIPPELGHDPLLFLLPDSQIPIDTSDHVPLAGRIRWKPEPNHRKILPNPACRCDNTAAVHSNLVPCNASNNRPPARRSRKQNKARLAPAWCHMGSRQTKSEES